MKLTKTCAKFLRKHGGTILAVAASVGVVATAIETGRATTKAKHLLEVDEALRKYNGDEQGIVEEPLTKRGIAKVCWKAYIPAAILGGGTIACILGSNALNKKQIASLTAAYMALGKTYQTYRAQVRQMVGDQQENAIFETTKSIEMTEKDRTGENAGTEKLLCYEPISKRYFHATEAELLTAFYEVNHDFAINGYIALNELYGYLNLDFVPELDDRGWSIDYLGEMWDNYWIDFNYQKQHTDDGLDVYYVTAFQEPIEDYLNFDPYKDYMESKGD
jgi:hypothetical protein